MTSILQHAKGMVSDLIEVSEICKRERDREPRLLYRDKAEYEGRWHLSGYTLTDGATLLAHKANLQWQTLVDVRQVRQVGIVEQGKSKPADETVKAFLRELPQWYNPQTILDSDSSLALWCCPKS